MNKPDTKAIREWMSTSQPSIPKGALLIRACARLTDLCDYIDGHECETWTGASPMQIREFVESDVNGDGLLTLRQIIDFIDNGPKPKTAREVIENYLNTAVELNCADLITALHKSGHLK